MKDDGRPPGGAATGLRISCPRCRSQYDIPLQKLKAYTSTITLPCPACGEGITLDPSTWGAPAKGAPVEAGPPRGEALKGRIMKSLKDLPPMPQVAEKARQTIDDPASSFTDLARVIETDQGIVTRVLKLANSPYYGVSGSVSSVQHAAVILGTQTLMELLTLACSSTMLSGRLTGYDLDTGDLWVHSLAVASGSQIIARQRRPELAQDAFSAGLIHDVGKLILDPYVQELKDEFRRFVEEGTETFLEAERRILGFDHSELASEVCGQWHIPQAIATAIRYHHEPQLSGGDDLANIVHVADAVALMSGIGAGLDGLLYTLDQQALASLRLTPDDIGAIMAAMVEYADKVTSAG